jgi:hypothetical protein
VMTSFSTNEKGVALRVRYGISQYAFVTIDDWLPSQAEVAVQVATLPGSTVW